jgi:hypothetical protein
MLSRRVSTCLHRSFLSVKFLGSPANPAQNVYLLVRVMIVLRELGTRSEDFIEMRWIHHR